MAFTHTIIAHFPSHTEAETVVRELQRQGFDMQKLSKVQTPWFGDSIGINLAWRFLLDGSERIFFVGIDLLASPQELVELGLVR